MIRITLDPATPGTGAIAIDPPLVAGEPAAVLVTGMAPPEGHEWRLVLSTHCHDRILSATEPLASVTDGYGATLELATRQIAAALALCCADGTITVALELVDATARASLCQTLAPLRNSVLAQGGTGDLPSWSVGVTVEQVEQIVSSALAPYATTEQVAAAIADALAPYATTAEVAAAIADALAPYATTAEVAAAIAAAIPSLPLSIANGGTGAATAEAARANLGAVSRVGDTMSGGLTVPILTVGSRAPESDVGQNSVAEGFRTEASMQFAHAEGDATVASGSSSHAEGSYTTASGYNAHAEGLRAVASGSSSHAEGVGAVAQNDAEHAQGSYNASHTGSTPAEQTLHSIGVGSDEDTRANAVEVMRDGSVFVMGVGGYDGTNPAGAQSLAAALRSARTHLRILSVAGASSIAPVAGVLVYRAVLPATGAIPPLDIPADLIEPDAYLLLELELRVPDPAPASVTAPASWTFVPDAPLPSSVTAGHVLHLSLRVDGTYASHPVLASCWYVA